MSMYSYFKRIRNPASTASDEDEERRVEEDGLLVDSNDEEMPSTSGQSQPADKAQAEAQAQTADETASSVPVVLDGELFQIVSRDKNKVTAQCKNRPSQVKGDITSTGNFNLHIKKHHPSLEKRLEDKRRAKETESASRKRAGGTLTTAFAKRANDAVAGYIVGAMRPISTVDHPDFRDMFAVLTQGDGSDLKGRKGMLACLRKQYTNLKDRIKATLSIQDYVCTTADIWSARNRSFMGMTCTYIDRHTLKRNCFALCCRRMKFSHTFDKIASEISSVHKEFGITEKVVCTVTDGGSNFSKAFREFGRFQEPALLTDLAESREEGTRSLSDKSQNRDMSESDSQSNMECDNDEEDHLDTLGPDEPLKVHELDFLITEEDEIFLPPQQRCDSHMLNLVGTKDIKDIEDPEYCEIFKSAFQKQRALWNRLSRSTNASDKCENLCGGKLPLPNDTRWNADFDCTEALLKKPREKINALCTAFQLPKFKQSEFEFLTEWTSVASPLAVTLDILQGEKNSFLGKVLPALRVLSEKLTDKKLAGLKYCQPLRERIANAITERFGNILVETESKDFKDHVTASLAHPGHKLHWVPDNMKNHCKNIFLEACKSEGVRLFNQKQSKDYICAEASETVKAKAQSETDKEEEFFSVLYKKKKSVASKTGEEAEEEAIKYLHDSRTDLPSLHDYPIVKEVFLRFNTTVPSSASVERLFSEGGCILVPRRGKTSDFNFEMFLLLKSNRLKV